MIRLCTPADFDVIHAIINEAAEAYRGVIPSDCWHDPYMSAAALAREIDAGMEFSGFDDSGGLTGVMGIQPVRDVFLIRHAYVRAAHRNRGIGAQLLRSLIGRATAPLLVGTWAAAVWAICFYQRHGFRLVSTSEKDSLLTTYWTISERQRENSVVLTR